MKNIREIAKLSGVSTATVSRYVNKKGNISPKTAEKIQKTLDKYNYKPNKLATVILNGKNVEIGLIVQNINNPFFSQLVNEIENNAHKKNLNLIVCNAQGDEQVERKYYDDLLSIRISGLMIINTNNEKIYTNSPIPILGIEKRILNYPKISVDNKLGMQLLIQNIKNIEQKKILYITSEKFNYAAKQRLESFQKIMKNKNIKYTVIKKNDEYKSLDSKINFLKEYNLVVCWSDMIAHYTYSQAIKAGLSVPQDIEIVGFDGLDLNNLFPYKLTTIKQNITQMGKISFETLNALINKEQVNDEVLNIELIKGQTTK